LARLPPVVAVNGEPVRSEMLFLESPVLEQRALPAIQQGSPRVPTAVLYCHCAFQRVPRIEGG